MNTIQDSRFKSKAALTILLLLTACCFLPTGLFGQGAAGPVLGGTNYNTLASAFSDPSVSWAATGLTLNYTAGTVYQNGSGNAITANTLTLTTNLPTCTQAGIQAGTCNIIYWSGGSSLANTASYATAAVSGNRILYYCTTNSSGNITGCYPTELDVNGAVPVTYGDAAYFVQPSACFMTAATTAFTSGPALVRTTANNQVLQAVTNTTAGTVSMTCDVTFSGRTTSGMGFQATDIELFYGVQGTAFSSISPATVATVTFPSPGAAAGSTVTAAGGSYTVTPSTLQTATTTSGNCYDEKVAFGTPFTYSNNSKVSFDQVFATSAAVTTVQICGVLVHGTWIQ
jgi:hypothetical protein